MGPSESISKVAAVDKYIPQSLTIESEVKGGLKTRLFWGLERDGVLEGFQEEELVMAAHCPVCGVPWGEFWLGCVPVLLGFWLKWHKCLLNRTK